MADQFVNITDPDSGEVGSVSADQLQIALSQGYRQATPGEVHGAKVEAKYGSTGQAAIGAGEQAASAATLGVSTGIERLLGVPGEDIQGRREANPIASGVGQVAGLLVPGAPEGEALQAVGKLAGEAVGTRVGSAAARMAAENALFQAGDETSKALAGDPNATASHALMNTGLAAVLGGGIGGMAGSAGALWHAAFGPQTERVLQAAQDRLGGTDVVGGDVGDSLQKIGIDTPPEIRAGLSDMPELQQMAKTLEQSDTTAGGLQYQKTLQGFRSDLNNSLVGSLGRTADQVDGLSEMSKYEAGKAIGSKLADEFDEKMGPVAQEFEELKARYAGVPLAEDAAPSVTNPLGTRGTASQIADKVGQLAQDQGWLASPSSDIMRETNRVLSEMPHLKTLRDLSNYITEVGNNMQADPLNRPLMRAGALIKNVLRDGEEQVALDTLKSKAPDLVERYQTAREAYGDLSKLKDAVDERLGTRARSASGFAKAVREMSSTDAETLLRRISGTGDADMLNTITEHFPQTSQMLREYHVDNLLKHAADRAKGDDVINANALLKAVSKMSPEMRQFALSPEALNRVAATDTILNQLQKLPHNFSNTARTLDKLTNRMSGSTLGTVAMLTGHHPITMALAGSLPKFIGRDVPDATRLALLKFMGSSEPANARGFAAAVNYIAHAMKGERALTNAAAGVFEASLKPLAESQLPDEKTRKTLDKQVSQMNPQQLLNLGTHSSTYMPDETTSMAEMAGTVLQTLAALKPKIKSGLPLDRPQPPSDAATAMYDRALDLAEQPLMAFQHIVDGTLVLSDVQLLQHMYPAVYQHMASELSNAMVEHLSDEGQIPYHVRIGLSKFLGQPLDSSMLPQAVQASQTALQNGVPGQQQPQQGARPSKTGMNKIKVAEMSALPTQAAANRQVFKA